MRKRWAHNKDRYALGVGVQMFLLDREVRRRTERGDRIDPDLIRLGEGGSCPGGARRPSGFRPVGG